MSLVPRYCPECSNLIKELASAKFKIRTLEESYKKVVAENDKLRQGLDAITAYVSIARQRTGCNDFQAKQLLQSEIGELDRLIKNTDPSETINLVSLKSRREQVIQELKKYEESK